jgi:hypothetical protein
MFNVIDPVSIIEASRVRVETSLTHADADLKMVVRGSRPKNCRDHQYRGTPYHLDIFLDIFSVFR